MRGEIYDMNTDNYEPIYDDDTDLYVSGVRIIEEPTEYDPGYALD